MRQYILSIDVGGTYIKAGIYDFQGKQVGIVKHHNHVIAEKSGYAEYEPEELWQTVCKCMREVIATTKISPKEIMIIGLSAQGSGCYFIGQNGTTIRNFISSSDQRGCEIAQRWEDTGINQKAFSAVYRKSRAGNTNTILAWLKENEPQNYHQIKWIFSMKDYLVYRLTGQIISGRGCMSASALMNMEAENYDKKLAEIFGIPEVIEKLGGICGDLEIAGGVTKYASEVCGCVVGTPVAAGLHDVTATAFAMGAIDEKYCFSIMGTCAINGYISERPVLNGTIHYNELFPIQRFYLIEEPGNISASVLEWAAALFFGDECKNMDKVYSQINEMVSAIGPEKSQLIFLPHLKGDEEPSTERGAWIGLGESHSKAEMLCAVFESVIFMHRIQLEQLFLNRKRPVKLLVGGGATQSSVWMQIFADVMGMPIEITDNEEMGAKGAAIAAAIAGGVYENVAIAVRKMTSQGKLIEPRIEYIPIYERKFQRFKKIMKVMKQVWDI